MNIYFEVITPNRIKVRTTGSYWEKIVSFKHPSMRGREEEVKLALLSPDQIRQSRKDPKILLYYKRFDVHYLCVIIRATNEDGFIVTTFKTEKIKEEEMIWPR